MALSDTHTLASVGRRAPPWSILSSLECREGLQGSWPLCCLGTGCSSNEPIQCLGSVQNNSTIKYTYLCSLYRKRAHTTPMHFTSLQETIIKKWWNVWNIGISVVWNIDTIITYFQWLWP